MEGPPGSFDELHEPQALSIDDLAALRFIARRGEQDLGDGGQRSGYRRARVAFEADHGSIVREFWGSRSAVGLVLTMGSVQRFRGLGMRPEVTFELHHAVGSAPTDFVIAFAHGDELAARASIVLRSSSAQRVIFERLFVAQALLVSALDDFGPDWMAQERSAEPVSPIDLGAS